MTIKVNGDRISAMCGNRGGVHKSVAYAGAKAVQDAIGAAGDVAIFAAAESLRICRWRYATGTYRADPCETIYEVTVQRDDSMDVALTVSGEYAETCLAAMQSELAANAKRCAGRGVPNDHPLDVGFDPKLHRTM